ncbi:hypothetical protein stinky91_gp067 [Flavobacterium phage vB_FspS_stinky9-1]|uniref:Uncharacterized protein n=1 Tax=Flavobacterium phage vB_FspS_stinky9-1 TaxID=2686277 RepID=A0A6B9LV80_9CAUD|nr:hypothetical protein HWC98_gp67 [Flavobacterium phage vB_FspS_stinky9-1]QHB40929.1 hypothetical protein stinky91_gp067 [Flavobacterium phage vB_FspS_stinky9-1]
MSINLRRKIGYWFLLILGLSLNTFQVYKYFTNQLEYNQLEFAVLIVGISFNFAPTYILRVFEKFVLKTNKNE